MTGFRSFNNCTGERVLNQLEAGNLKCGTIAYKMRYYRVIMDHTSLKMVSLDTSRVIHFSADSRP